MVPKEYNRTSRWKAIEWETVSTPKFHSGVRAYRPESQQSIQSPQDFHQAGRVRAEELILLGVFVVFGFLTTLVFFNMPGFL